MQNQNEPINNVEH